MQQQHWKRPSIVGLDRHARVLTPTGWVLAGHVRVGDSLIDVDGKPCAVLAVTSTAGPVAQVELADGSALTAGCDQLWQVEAGPGPYSAAATMTTVEVANSIAAGSSIRLVRGLAVATADRGDRPLNGYLLGVLLGDGGLSSPDAVVLWTSEQATRARAEAALPAGAVFSDRPARQPRCTGWGIVGSTARRGGNPVLNALRELGLTGLRSFEKFIPEPYLWAPVEDRVALLNGLLDTDAGVTSQGNITYSSASPQLAEDVVHLVRSLGGRCRLNVRRNVTYTAPTVREPKAARDSYRVSSIHLPEFNPFTLPRKAMRVRPSGRTRQWTVRSVKPAGIAELVALDVDSTSGGYLADGFIPVVGGCSAADSSTLMQAA